MTERWRRVEGWPYEVSDRGRVRRTKPGPGTRPGRIMEGTDDHGYVRYNLRDSGRQWQALGQKLVALAFIGPPPEPEGYHVDHINRDRKDNRVENLRWLTIGENVWRDQDRRGENHPLSKVSAEDVREMRHRYEAEDDLTHRDLADEYDLSRRHIGDILNGVKWGHVK